ncbi:MAG: tetratricopeptide repeat protein [Phycisphaerales bacterium]|nr:MAG: tetratricopeptide repeat protein [Phycisphaerales bacterium]
MSRKNARMLLVSLVCSAGLLTGCTQSNRNKEYVSTAKAKADAMKAGTEFQMAHQAFLAGDLSKARTKVEQSLSLNPNVARSHVLRGRILMEQSQLGPALEAMEMAKAISEESAEAWYYEGIVFERLTQRERALNSFMTAARLDNTNAGYHIAAAEVFVDLGRYDDAEEFLHNAGSQFEHNSGVRHTLGQIAMLQGDFERAAVLFNEARLLAPDELAIVEDLVDAQIRSNRFNDAESNLSRLLSRTDYKNRRDLQHLRANCLIELDRFSEARQVLMELTNDSEGANDIDAWIKLGRVSVAMRDERQLRRCAQRAVAIAPNRADGHMLMAVSLRLQNRNDDALRSVDRAITAEPNNVNAHTMRGMILQDLGRTVHAREAFRNALAIDPNNQTVRALARGGSASPVATVPTDGND